MIILEAISGTPFYHPGCERCLRMQIPSPPLRQRPQQTTGWWGFGTWPGRRLTLPTIHTQSAEALSQCTSHTARQSASATAPASLQYLYWVPWSSVVHWPCIHLHRPHWRYQDFVITKSVTLPTPWHHNLLEFFKPTQLVVEKRITQNESTKPLQFPWGSKQNSLKVFYRRYNLPPLRVAHSKTCLSISTPVLWCGDLTISKPNLKPNL